MKKSIFIMLTFFALSLTSSHLLALQTPKELYWEDLVPKDFTMPPVSMEHAGSMAQVAPNAPLIQSLDGTLAKIPGFVVPLEGDSEFITEFLLVPYFGACVHVPPPPSNQIVYVKFAEGVPMNNLYDAVWVTGELSTEGWTGDIASVGYSMTGISLTPFDG
ncbi:MAG: hypothetical protein ACJAVV_000280 [Alphaproteobacteria bacterium]|jgi:hypothetical protein